MSVAGKWQVAMDTPLGRQDFTWDLVQTGQGYRGSMHSRAGATPLADICVEGAAFSFGTRVQGALGSLDLAFEGSTASDTVSGTCRTRFGDFRFSGERL